MEKRFVFYFLEKEKKKEKKKKKKTILLLILIILFYYLFIGLKTGMYYLRTKPAVDAIKFTIDQTQIASIVPSKGLLSEQNDLEQQKLLCSLENKDACVMCSS